MTKSLVKVRVLFSYRGTECELFGGASVPAGAILEVTQERARQLIADGNAAPILKGQKTEAADKLGNAPGATDGEAAPSASLQVAQASPAKTVTKQPAAKKAKAGKSSR